MAEAFEIKSGEWQATVQARSEREDEGGGKKAMAFRGQAIGQEWRHCAKALHLPRSEPVRKIDGLRVSPT